MVFGDLFVGDVKVGLFVGGGDQGRGTVQSGDLFVAWTLTPFRSGRIGVTWSAPAELRVAAARGALLATRHNQTARKERDDHVGEEGVEPRGVRGAVEADAKHQEGEHVTPKLARGWREPRTKEACVVQGKGCAQGDQAEEGKAHALCHTTGEKNES